MHGIFESTRDPFLVSTDPGKLELDTIHAFLTDSYWAKGISEEKVARSMEHSLCFGLYESSKQIGFARVLTDYVHTAHLADVFIIESYRGRGLAKWLVESVISHPDLQGLRRWTLATRDAHGLYSKFGFVPLSHPDRFMQRDSGCDFGERSGRNVSPPSRSAEADGEP